MGAYRILVVDDSAFMRKIITDIISEDPRFEVVQTAKNGKEAVEKVKQLQPDAVTLDIEMPEMNGLEALKMIMSDTPTPTIMLSSITFEGAKETILALELGAVDFARKPSGPISLDLHKVKAMLLEKLAMAVQTKVKKNVEVIKQPSAMVRSVSEKQANREGFQQIVAIGTSTGGPRALQQVLSGIPEDFPAPILIVQHMPPKFTSSLAQRLDASSLIRVVEARDSSVLRRGTAYIAPGGWHMALEKHHGSYRIRLSDSEPRAGHRPSVDHLFESLIPYQELKRHVVLMTGMGSDGAKGMKALKESGAESTIAESEETCIVFGMPRSAIVLNGADYVVPLHDIAGKLIQLVAKNKA